MSGFATECQNINSIHKHFMNNQATESVDSEAFLAD